MQANIQHATLTIICKARDLSECENNMEYFDQRDNCVPTLARTRLWEHGRVLCVNVANKIEKANDFNATRPI